jgi:hypothetical protein
MGDNVTAIALVAGISARWCSASERDANRVDIAAAHKYVLPEHGASAFLALGRRMLLTSRTRPQNPLMNSYRAADGKGLAHRRKLSGMGADEGAGCDRASRGRASRRVATTSQRGRPSIFDEIFGRHARDEWATIPALHDVWWALINAYEDVVNDAQARAIGAFVEMPSMPATAPRRRARRTRGLRHGASRIAACATATRRRHASVPRTERTTRSLACAAEGRRMNGVPLVGFGVARRGMYRGCAGLSRQDDAPRRRIPAGRLPPISRRASWRLSLQPPQRVIVDNRPGAGGIIGTELAANAWRTATLLLSGNNTRSRRRWPAHRATIPRRASRIAQIALPTGVFVSAFAARDVPRPRGLRQGESRQAHPCIGRQWHAVAPVPRCSSARRASKSATSPTRARPRGPDLIGGQVDMLDVDRRPQEQVKAGRLRILAVSSPERLEQLPQVPAIAESLPGYSFETWLAIFGPARHAPPRAEARRRDRARVEGPGTGQAHERCRFKASYLSPENTAARMSTEQKMFAR